MLGWRMFEETWMTLFFGSKPMNRIKIRLHIVPFLLFGTVLSLPGCDARGPRQDASWFEVQDSGGVVLVRNGAIGSLGKEPLGLEEELRIGVVEGEEHLQFFQVHDLAMDGNGTLFVGNSMTGTVRVFTRDGEFLGEFGGRGEGPGEVSMVNQVWLAGDSVVVVDWQRGGKTIVFTKTGDLVATWRSMQPDNSRISIFGFSAGNWAGFFDPPFQDQQSEAAPGEPVEFIRDLHYLLPEVDSVGGVFVALPPRVLYGTVNSDGLDWGLFEPRSTFGFDGVGNFFLSSGHPYRIDVFDPDGRLARRIGRTYSPVLITDEDVAAVVELLPSPIDTMSRIPSELRAGERERVEARVKEQASYPRPDTLACLGRLLVARDGAFWVERVDALSPVETEIRKMWGGFGRSSGSETSWDVFDREGRFLGQVGLPSRFAPMAVEERTVVGVHQDSMDVEYVVRYRLTRPSDPNLQ